MPTICTEETTEISDKNMAGLTEDIPNERHDAMYDILVHRDPVILHDLLEAALKHLRAEYQDVDPDMCKVYKTLEQLIQRRNPTHMAWAFLSILHRERALVEWLFTEPHDPDPRTGKPTRGNQKAVPPHRRVYLMKSLQDHLAMVMTNQMTITGMVDSMMDLYTEC